MLTITSEAAPQTGEIWGGLVGLGAAWKFHKPKRL
jgi:hypothetical protein